MNVKFDHLNSLTKTVDYSSPDPLKDQCWLVYPSPEIFSAGPYNRARGERVYSWFQDDKRTKGHLVLLDDDMIPYLVGVPGEEDVPGVQPVTPKRLAMERAKVSDPFNPGPLTKQERLFFQLYRKHAMTRNRLTPDILQSIQQEAIIKSASYMCYCRKAFREWDLPEDIVECSHIDCEYVYFHRSCVKDLHLENVSNWYCKVCSAEMKELARRTLSGEERPYYGVEYVDIMIGLGHCRRP